MNNRVVRIVHFYPVSINHKACLAAIQVLAMPQQIGDNLAENLFL
jgi:hypothetical protein